VAIRIRLSLAPVSLPGRNRCVSRFLARAYVFRNAPSRTHTAMQSQRPAVKPQSGAERRLRTPHAARRPPWEDDGGVVAVVPGVVRGCDTRPKDWRRMNGHNSRTSPRLTPGWTAATTAAPPPPSSPSSPGDRRQLNRDTAAEQWNSCVNRMTLLGRGQSGAVTKAWTDQCRFFDGAVPDESYCNRGSDLLKAMTLLKFNRTFGGCK